jgi:hypothetical protein
MPDLPSPCDPNEGGSALIETACLGTPITAHVEEGSIVARFRRSSEGFLSDAYPRSGPSRL